MSYLNFAKTGQARREISSLPSPSTTEPMLSLFDNDNFDAGSPPPDVVPSLRDDLQSINSSTVSEFTACDQQLVILHSELRSSAAQNQCYNSLWVFELVAGVQLPYSESIANSLKKDLKKLWKLESKFYCGLCHSSLEKESSECNFCKDKSTTMVICTADVRQQLLHIVKRFGDFSAYQNGDNAHFKLTINTDGFVPSGHGKRELWPVFIQPADIAEHYKTMHESVAVQAVIADNGKPSEFAFECALTSLVEWLHDQGDGLSLSVSNTKQLKVFFEVHNLSLDLAGVCHIFHFASWSSKSEACMLCKVQPVRDHNAQRWGIIDNFIRRNNLNITADMLHRRGGFEQGTTFWMKLANVLNYRFDNLHKLCEGVCASLLNELFGSSKKMGTLLKIRRTEALERVVRNISWPRNTKIVFSKLNIGHATEKLGSFLIAVPLALSTSTFTYEHVIWILGILSIISSEFVINLATVNKKTLLQKLAKLQDILCGTVFNTLKFHCFYCHLFEKLDLTEKVSTFVFESLNRYIKLKFDANHQNGFTSAILDKYLLERFVRYELQRRANYCPEVKSYVERIDWRGNSGNGVEVGDFLLKDEIKSIGDRTYYGRQYTVHVHAYHIKL